MHTAPLFAARIQITGRLPRVFDIFNFQISSSGGTSAFGVGSFTLMVSWELHAAHCPSAIRKIAYSRFGLTSVKTYRLLQNEEPLSNLGFGFNTSRSRRSYPRLLS